MEQPQIRYARTDDGISIAYTTLGDGEPLVVTPPLGYSHIQLELAYPPLRAWYERMARLCKVVRFDGRAQGLSQRNVTQVPPDWGMRDIDAVVADLRVDAVDLLGCGAAGFAACEYAARRPHRVRRLILWSVIADGTPWGSAQVEAALSLAGKDYVTFTETVAGAILGWQDPSRAHQWAQFMRAAMSEVDYRRFHAAGSLGVGASANTAETLHAIEAPTVVIHPASVGNMEVQAAQQLASSVPTAKLVVCTDDDTGLPIGEQATRAIARALGVEPSAADVEQVSGTRTILFTDLVGHTEMMRRLGDAKGREVLREHERITRAVLKQYGGAEVKTMGDGFMASFVSVTKATDCAIELQRALAAHEGEPLQVRVGLNVGEPIEEDGDYFGSAVILASRIAAQAAAGEILIPELLRHLLTGKSYVYVDRGERTLKGFEDAVRLYEVAWRE
jgi:class 3 adenylate cyclase